MSQLVADCPRCGASRTTFDLHGDLYVGLAYEWQTRHEIFAKCRHCHRGAMFYAELGEHDAKHAFRDDGKISAYKGSVNDAFKTIRPITSRDIGGAPAPELVPEAIAKVFLEGTASYAAGCFNAAGAMFRLVLDITTKSLLPTDGEEPQPNRDQRMRLAPRLEFLFHTGKLPRNLEPLAECVRQDGNDAAHDGTLTAVEAADLLDFTTALLERVYTEPGRLKAAWDRRDARRADAKSRA